jgi:hypothetical protein
MSRTTKADVELLRWWREWLHALDAEMAAVDQRDEERRHKRVECSSVQLQKLRRRDL